jgi:hypothetical protein
LLSSYGALSQVIDTAPGNVWILVRHWDEPTLLERNLIQRYSAKLVHRGLVDKTGVYEITHTP